MIRRAEKRDAERLSRLWMDLLESQACLDERFGPSEDALVRWRNDFPEWVSRDSRRVFVAEESGEIQGFVTAERWTSLPIYRHVPEIYIDELYVTPEFRRRGIGRTLVDTVREWGKSVGVERLRAGVLASNDQGREFWEKAGLLAFTVTYTVDLAAVERAEIRRSKLGF
jgi:GNAT superfamily N-acetyltransferase